MGIKAALSYPERPVLMNSESNLGLHYHHWQCKRSTSHSPGKLLRGPLKMSKSVTHPDPLSWKEMQAPIYFKDSQMILKH